MRSVACLHGPYRERSFGDRSSLKEGVIGFAVFGDPVNSAGHFGGYCGISLSAQMGVLSVLGDVTL